VLYRVSLSDTREFAYENRSSGWISADNWRVSPPLSEGLWYWRVQAKDNTGKVGEFSGIRSFRVDVTPPPAPQLLEPENGITTADNRPRFRWAAVTDNSAPVTYRLQVDNNSNFSSPELDISGLTENSFTPENGLPMGSYWWRVQASDNAGNVGPWSSARVLLIGISRGVEVTITPSYENGAPGARLTFTVVVKNVGNVADNYRLENVDNLGWPLSLDSASLLDIPPGENRTTYLKVTIPSGAAHCTSDNVTVVAISQGDNAVRDNASCIAHAVIERRVEVSILPSSQTGAPGARLTFTVVVKNVGNVADNYSLAVEDNSGWGPTITPETLELAAGENKAASLSVVVPKVATHLATDNIRVTATSKSDEAVKASATCIAQASLLRAVEISISPSYQTGPPGATVIFTCTLRNAGMVEDTYILSASSGAGWTARVEPTSISLAPGSSGTATISVTIPKDASSGASMIVYVRATSSGDVAVSASETCRVVAVSGVAEKVTKLPLVPLAASVAAVLAVALAIKFFPRRGRPRFILRERKAAKGGVLRGVAWGKRTPRG
jgi:hypothetical protein